jgi:uncharacterized CHY-type Zn-finger protein
MVTGSNAADSRRKPQVVDEMEEELRRLRKKARSDPTQKAISLGTSLPQNGACSHFRSSLRWLRFGCCGRAFPCPTCHEQSGCPAAASGGMGARANRMICGKCSFEQPFSNSPCGKCAYAMGQSKSSSGRHWSGGSGSRNVATLSNKESKKFKGGQKSDTAKSKSASKKSSRVGLAGKKAREKKANSK